jgi:hypothetical protein
MVRSSSLSSRYVILIIVCECHANYDLNALVLIDTFLAVHSLSISFVCQIVCKLFLCQFHIYTEHIVAQVVCSFHYGWYFCTYLTLLFTSGCMWICQMTEHHVLTISTSSGWVSYFNCSQMVCWSQLSFDILVDGSQRVCDFIVYPYMVTSSMSRLHKITGAGMLDKSNNSVVWIMQNCSFSYTWQHFFLVHTYHALCPLSIQCFDLCLVNICTNRFFYPVDFRIVSLWHWNVLTVLCKQTLACSATVFPCLPLSPSPPHLTTCLTVTLTASPPQLSSSLSFNPIACYTLLTILSVVPFDNLLPSANILFPPPMLSVCTCTMMCS